MILFPFLALHFATSCLGTLIHNVEDLHARTFDFVVVGGGAGGGVVANRLSENPKFSVLLLEAGGSNEGVTNAIVPLFKLLLPQFVPIPGPIDWNYTSVPQAGLNNRVVGVTRGYILGGTTSTNGMAYVRGSSDDYDRYARVTGDPGWSWQRLQPYIRKNERWTQPAGGRNTTGEFNPSVHGFHGVNSVSLEVFPWPVNSRFIRAVRESNSRYPFNLDYNSGNQLGFGHGQSTVKDGQRSSSATSYLGPDFIARPNLHVLVNARVTRLIQTNAGPSKPSFHMVEFAQRGSDARVRVRASKEVILSAGSIGTPQILLNSGIGDANELEALGIRSRVHLSDVGKNVSVHIGLAGNYLVNSTETYDNILRNETLRTELFVEWNRTHVGPLADTQSSFIGFFRLPKSSPLFKKYPDPSAGPHSGHFLSVFQNGLTSNTPPTGHYVQLSASLLAPTSRGTISLNTTNPFDQPLINLNSLTTDYDIAAVVEGFKLVQPFLQLPAWKGYVLQRLTPPPNVTSDDDLKEYIRAHISPTGHITGSSAMSPKGAKYGVVDPDLRVKGVAGLRVVDASILPFVPSGNTQAPTYIIAERASDLIKDAWKH